MRVPFESLWLNEIDPKFDKVCLRFHRSESVYTVVLQKSTPAQLRQLILYISNNQGSVDRILRELTSEK